MNFVGVVESVLILTALGLIVFSENGNIFVPGYPFTTSLIWTVIGTVSSLDWKYKSTELTKTPPLSSIKKVWARGSHQPTCLLVSLVDVLVISLLSVVFVLCNLGSLVDKIVSCWVSKIPLAV